MQLASTNFFPPSPRWQPDEGIECASLPEVSTTSPPPNQLSKTRPASLHQITLAVKALPPRFLSPITRPFHLSSLPPAPPPALRLALTFPAHPPLTLLTPKQPVPALLPVVRAAFPRANPLLQRLRLAPVMVVVFGCCSVRAGCWQCSGPCGAVGRMVVMVMAAGRG